MFPGQLIPGYEHCTGHSWPALMHTSSATGHFILVAFRLVGALLTANAIALWAPITYDLTTGAIGPFELLEWVLLAAVLLALIATWCFFPVGRAGTASSRPVGVAPGLTQPAWIRRAKARPAPRAFPGSG